MLWYSRGKADGCMDLLNLLVDERYALNGIYFASLFVRFEDREPFRIAGADLETADLVSQLLPPRLAVSSVTSVVMTSLDAKVAAFEQRRQVQPVLSWAAVKRRHASGSGSVYVPSPRDAVEATKRQNLSVVYS